jgi:hypothetical protein
MEPTPMVSPPPGAGTAPQVVSLAPLGPETDERARPRDRLLYAR